MFDIEGNTFFLKNGCVLVKNELFIVSPKAPRANYIPSFWNSLVLTSTILVYNTKRNIEYTDYIGHWALIIYLALDTRAHIHILFLFLRKIKNVPFC